MPAANAPKLPTAAEATYRWHGIDIFSALPLAFPPCLLPQPAAQHLRIVADPSLAAAPGRCLSISPHTGYGLFRDPGPDGGCWLARDTDRMHFTRDEIRVSPTPDAARLEYLQTRALALWLQMVGMAPIHASAVANEAGALALLGKSGAGKSTLAAALLGCGFHLCADDLLPLAVVNGEVPVHPGRQQLALWMDSAREFHSAAESLPIVTLEGDKRGWRPPLSAPAQVPRLRAIFVLERGSKDANVKIERMPASAALLTLMRNGQMAGPAEQLGHGAEKLRVLSAALRCLSVYTLRYPSHYGRLDEVCAALDAAMRAS